MHNKTTQNVKENGVSQTPVQLYDPFESLFEFPNWEQARCLISSVSNGSHRESRDGVRQTQTSRRETES